MPTLQIEYTTQEELCELLRTTLERLPDCESLRPGRGLIQELQRTSETLQIGSISEPDVKPSSQPEPAKPTQTSSPDTVRGVVGEPVQEDRPGPRGTVAGPVAVMGQRELEEGLRQIRTRLLDLEPLGGGEGFASVVTVVDDKGRITRQRKVPTDLFLEKALAEGGLFTDVLVGVSRGMASILNLGDRTVTAALAGAGGTTPEIVHLLLGLPIVDVPVIGPEIRDALLREADIQLLRGDVEGLAASARFVVAERPDDAFPGIPTKRMQDVVDRISGNLEILRIEQQQEF